MVSRVDYIGVGSCAESWIRITHPNLARLGCGPGKAAKFIGELGSAYVGCWDRVAKQPGTAIEAAPEKVHGWGAVSKRGAANLQSVDRFSGSVRESALPRLDR